MLRIDPSIDYVNIFISLNNASPFDVHALLESGGFVCTRNRPGTCLFEKISLRSYQVSARRVFKDNYCLGTSVRIPRPDRQLIYEIEQLFSGMYTISTAEFTLDIFADDHSGLFTLLRRITHLKWAGQTLDLSYEKTFYLGNPRKSKTKGVRCYIKELGQQATSVRLEIVHKRVFFRKGKIVPLPELGRVRVQDAFKHVQFKKLDRLQVSPCMKQLGIYKGEVGEMYQPLTEVAEMFARSTMDILSGDYSAHYARDVLKNLCVPKYQQDEFQEIFDRLTSGMTFL